MNKMSRALMAFLLCSSTAASFCPSFLPLPPEAADVFSNTLLVCQMSLCRDKWRQHKLTALVKCKVYEIKS